MKVLANENFPLLAVEALREAGHDVVWARTEMTGDGDARVLRRAHEAGWLLVTFGKDFGELAFRAELPAQCGVILFRLRIQSPENARQCVLETLQSRRDWQGCFAVVEPSRTRIRPLPGSSTSPPSTQS